MLDIVCLQEACPTSRNIEQIDSMLKPMYAYQDTTMHVNGGNCLMLLSKYPILSKERIPYESKGNMKPAYRLKVKDREVLLINNHLETTGLSLEDRRQFKNLVIGKLQVVSEVAKLLVRKTCRGNKRNGLRRRRAAKYIQQHK